MYLAASFAGAVQPLRRRVRLLKAFDLCCGGGVRQYAMPNVYIATTM